MIRVRPLLVSTFILGASALTAACNDGAGPGSDAGGGAAQGAGGAGSGGSTADGGGGGGTGIVEGAPDSCLELGGTIPDPDYPGFDRTWLEPGKAPEGCDGDFEVGRTWTMHVDAAEPLVRISFPEGVVHANGVECVSSTGVPARVIPQTRIRVVGGPAADKIVIDMADGFPSELGWTPSTGLVLELGGGDNALVVRGGESADVIAFRRSDGYDDIDLDGDEQPDAIATGLTSVVLALGPGDDVADAFGWGNPLSVPIALCGGTGNDRLRGGSAIDRLEGADGNDDLVAAAVVDSADLVSGGEGFDRADYSARGEAVTISVEDDANDGASGEGDNVLGDVEWLVGGAGADSLRGSVADERLEGGPGDDAIEGRGGRDVMFGGDGDDVFLATSDDDGADFMEGGAGSDSVSYAGRTVGVEVSLCMTDVATEDCQPGACSCAADDGAPGEGDLIADVEMIHGTEGADHLVGTAFDDVFYGYGGDDVIEGREGNDSMYGDEGNDVLSGAEGDDFLDGSIGFDSFEAGIGDGDICIVEASEAPTACELF